MVDFTEIITFLNKSEAHSISAFAPLQKNILTFAKGIPILGFTIFFIYNYLFKLFGATKMIDFHIDKLMVMALIMVFFKAYTTIMPEVQNILKKPRTEMLKAMNAGAQGIAKELDDIETKAIKAEQEARDRFDDKNLAGKAMDIGSGIAKVPKQIILSIYSLILIIGIAVFYSILIIQICMSIWGSSLMVALGPLAFGLQFIPAYSGILANYFKNLLAVNIIGAACAGFGAGLFELDIMDYLFRVIIEANIAVHTETTVGIDIMPLITIIILSYLAASIPSFVDKVINTSAGGAFSGAMSGGAVLGAAIGMAKAQSMKATGAAAGGAMNIAKDVLLGTSEKQDKENQSNKRKGGLISQMGDQFKSADDIGKDIGKGGAQIVDGVKQAAKKISNNNNPPIT
jgi:hypothetical protein